MTLIFINGERMVNIEYIQNVHSVEVKALGLVHKLRPRAEAQLIADFVYNCCQKCTGVIMFNNCIIQKEDVQRIEL